MIPVHKHTLVALACVTGVLAAAHAFGQGSTNEPDQTASEGSELLPDIRDGETGAGWLLSPQYRPNESLVELHYQWRRSTRLAVDVRIRHRKELEQLVLASQKNDELDFYIRFTWGGTIS